MFQRTFLTGLALTLFVIQACGSDDGKKHVKRSPDAGGEGGGQEPSAGGSASGAPDVGMAGMPMMIEGGTGGTPAVVEDGGAAGGPVVVPLPEPELLFTVKPGSLGLADTALSKQANAQNVIYASNTGSPDPVDGTNAVKVTGADIGLDPTDQIVAFAIAQAVPTNPVYLFSVADGAEGSDPTRVYQSYWSEAGTEEGDVYFSDGVQAFRYLGEGGDQYGYNAMTATEVSLGLSPGDSTNPEDTHPPDDLKGLAPHDAREPITELYFTVASVAVGAADSAVALLAADERPCTVFKSALDGTNAVAFSCADLGLIAGDQIDGLAVYGTAKPTSVVFSVADNAVGAANSAVNASYSAEDTTGSNLYESKGDATNTLLKGSRDLGLSDFTYDEIDGLAVVDAPAQPSVQHAAACTPSYDPLDAAAGGGLVQVNGTMPIGPNVVVLFGSTATPTARLIAYSTTTCALLQQKDMPVGFETAAATAIVPLAGWTAAKALDKVEYWRDTTPAYSQELQRYDDAGVADATSIPVNGTDYSYARRVIYEPIARRLYTLSQDSQDYRALRLAVMPLPTADTVSIDPESYLLPGPCNDTNVAGTDALGNVYLAQLQANGDGTEYRVCGYSRHGSLLPSPYSWVSDTAALLYNVRGGLIAPGGTHYLFHVSAAPITFERGTLQAP